jgi:hypothetical protein
VPQAEFLLQELQSACVAFHLQKTNYSISVDSSQLKLTEVEKKLIFKDSQYLIIDLALKNENSTE